MRLSFYVGLVAFALTAEVQAIKVGKTIGARNDEFSQMAQVGASVETADLNHSIAKMLTQTREEEQKHKTHSQKQVKQSPTVAKKRIHKPEAKPSNTAQSTSTPVKAIEVVKEKEAKAQPEPPAAAPAPAPAPTPAPAPADEKKAAEMDAEKLKLLVDTEVALKMEKFQQEQKIKTDSAVKMQIAQDKKVLHMKKEAKKRDEMWIKLEKELEQAEEKKNQVAQAQMAAPLPPIMMRANPGWPGFSPAGGAAYMPQALRPPQPMPMFMPMPIPAQAPVYAPIAAQTSTQVPAQFTTPMAAPVAASAPSPTTALAQATAATEALTASAAPIENLDPALAAQLAVTTEGSWHNPHQTSGLINSILAQAVAKSDQPLSDFI